MTDPLEDRLRSHLADRAARVTVDPDPAAVVERSAGRRRFGAPLVAGVVAVAALLAGGGFATGMAVAGPSPAATAPALAAPEAGALSTTTTGPGGVSSAAEVPALTRLFVRTTDGGVTIRAYAASTVPVPVCPSGATCSSPGSVPPTVPCPPGAECAQPVTTPGVVPIATAPVSGSGSGSSSGSTGSGSSGSGVSGPPGSTPVTTTTAPPTTSCRQLTLELSTPQAVWSTTVPAPAADGPGPTSVQLVDTGTFGGAEGSPTAYAVVAVSSDVAAVRLVSASGALLDAMAPTAGIAVVATTDGAGLAGATVVGLDAAGTAVATVPSDQGTSAVSGGCTVPTPLPAPGATAPGGTPTTTTGPTTSTVVPGRALPSIEPATRQG